MIQQMPVRACACYSGLGTGRFLDTEYTGYTPAFFMGMKTSESTSAKITVIIAEDHLMFRQSLTNALNDFPNLNVIAGANNGKELLSLLKTSVPDIILLDLKMPEMDGFQALDKIKRLNITAKVIILSMHTDEFYTAEVIIKGAHGFVKKTEDVDKLAEIIESVHQGNYYFDKNISDLFIPAIIGKAHRFLEAAKLSKIEIDVLRLICEEQSSKQIAEELNLTLKGVEYHRKNIYEKTQIKSLAGLVKFAIKLGITSIF